MCVLYLIEHHLKNNTQANETRETKQKQEEHTCTWLHIGRKTTTKQKQNRKKT